MTQLETKLRNWTTVRLDDFCVTSSGGTPSRDTPAFYENGTIPWVKSGELSQKIVTETSERITTEALEKSSAKMVKKGAILVAMYGATVGQIAILGIDAATNQAVCAIEPDQSRCLPRFLYYSLVQKVPELLQMRVGGAQPNISQKLIRDLKFDLPRDLREQARIVELLDQADALRLQRAETDAKFALLLPALFRHHFGDPATEIPIVRLGNLVHEFRYGTSVKSGDSGTSTLRIPNVVRGQIDYRELVRTELVDTELSRITLDDGDVLFVRTNGNRDYVGRCAVFTAAEVPNALKDESFTFASYLIRAKPRKELIVPEYLTTFLASSTGRNALLQKANTSAGQYNINTESLSALSIPTPSLSDQQRFCAEFGRVRNIQTQAAASAAKLETLFQTLLHRAFTGELTARWREAHLREGVQEMTRLSRA